MKRNKSNERSGLLKESKQAQQANAADAQAAAKKQERQDLVEETYGKLMNLKSDDPLKLTDPTWIPAEEEGVTARDMFNHLTRHELSNLPVDKQLETCQKLLSDTNDTPMLGRILRGDSAVKKELSLRAEMLDKLVKADPSPSVPPPTTPPPKRH